MKAMLNIFFSAKIYKIYAPFRGTIVGECDTWQLLLSNHLQKALECVNVGDPFSTSTFISYNEQLLSNAFFLAVEFLFCTTW